MEQYLAIVDADKIHDYVFSPHELKLIRGGSAIQSLLCHEHLPSLVGGGGEVIFSGGGTVLARFPGQDEARYFCRKAEAEFMKQTHIATATTAMVRYPDGKFESANRELRALLELRKQSPAHRTFSGGNPFGAICESCGLHPVTHVRRVEPGQTSLMCLGCQIRREGSNRKLFYPPDVEPTVDLEAIGAVSRPENYIAFLYIDLDRLGKFLKDNAGNSEADYRHLSQAIDKAVVQGVRGTCEEMFPARQAVYEILLMGGDDAVLVVPAQHGFEFVRLFECRLKKEFSRECGERWQVPPFSAGMVIAHSHFPISEFLRHANELLASAKTVVDVDALDYAILTPSMTDSVLDERRKIAIRGGGHSRTRKPYVLKDFADLIDAVGRLKPNIAASKLKTLYGIAYESVGQATLDYWYLLDRLEEETANELRSLVGRDLWREAATNAADVAELAEFIS
jgi:hypothetical protein